MNIADEMLDSVRDDPNLLQRVITGDEAWVYGYDVETKAQSPQWKCRTNQDRKKRAKFALQKLSFAINFQKYFMDTLTLSTSESENEVVGGTSDISSDENTEIYSYDDSESELESENEEFGSPSTSSFYVGRDQTTRWKTSE
ncbi:hypothetical protein LAZ67_2003277 [Cordylochernes scorpioides]|uniref:Uncharacterized protein n=1 Tax=Cordylochernes scorpioides TaxID=51811 RepID=A0ABY6K2S0_9ARAC|nr:hypothetical protein LAZ67_2003277 [Cordylochernes scorpioides]